jgi:hypothetical protein
MSDLLWKLKNFQYFSERPYQVSIAEPFYFFKIFFLDITQFSVKGALISHIGDCDDVLKRFGANSVQYERNSICLNLRNVTLFILIVLSVNLLHNFPEVRRL